MAYVRPLTIIMISLSLFCCDSDEGEKVDVVPKEEPEADFSYELHGNCNSPVLEVWFINESKNSDSYEWNFGDGTSSTETSPRKVYAKAGSYIITLKAVGERTANQLQKEISISRSSDGTGPKVSLSYERTSPDRLQVEFTISTEGEEYVLHFGDGGILISNEANIQHTYSGRGLFEAMVAVGNGNCASVLVDFDN